MENRVKNYINALKKSSFVEKSNMPGENILHPNCLKSWDKIKHLISKKLKKEGFENYYFPMFIPLENFKKQKEHFEGFIDELIIAKHVGKKKIGKRTFCKANFRNCNLLQFKKNY